MSRALSLLLALLAASVAAAGCVQGPSDAGTVEPQSGLPARAADLPTDWVLGMIPTGEKHDHGDPAQHQNLSTPNFHVLGWDPLVTDHYGATVHGMGCGGVGATTEGRKIAIVHSISTDVAFVVADVTDPTKPTKLGEYVLPNVVVWDATITPDGQHALVGAYPFIFGGDELKLPGGAALPESIDARPPVAVQPLWRDACTGETREAGPEQYLLMGPSIIMVGLQDPTNPTLEQWIPQPVIGPHSVYSVAIDGTTYAVSSVTNLVHEASYYTIFEVRNGPTGGVLVPLSVIQAPGRRLPSVFDNGHTDVAIHKHPGTGQVLAYLANWNTGVEIYDISIPQAPLLVGSWADGEAGNMHNTLPLPVMWGEKHYSIVGQEVGRPEDRPSGWIYLLDTTDPANPTEVSRWTLPIEPDWDSDDGLLFSTHYVDVLNRTMFVTNYHGGMWAVDLTDETAPRTVGHFLPDRLTPMPLGEQQTAFGVEDVVVDPVTGVLTVWDNGGGIYQIHFDLNDPAPAITEWQVAGEKKE